MITTPEQDAMRELNTAIKKQHNYDTEVGLRKERGELESKIHSNTSSSPNDFRYTPIKIRKEVINL